jgi:hypothetical protein
VQGLFGTTIFKEGRVEWICVDLREIQGDKTNETTNEATNEPSEKS